MVAFTISVITIITGFFIWNSAKQKAIGLKPIPVRSRKNRNLR